MVEVNSVCCQTLAAGSAPAVFDRVIALGYYDGPTEGVLSCGACGKNYVFRMCGWDPDDDDVRVFELRPVGNSSLDSVLEIFAHVGPPRSPVWLPLWRFDTPELERQASDDIAALLRPIGTARLIIATSDLAGSISAARRVDHVEPDRTVEDWLRWLDD